VTSVAVAPAAAPTDAAFVPAQQPNHLLRTGLIVALLTTVVVVGSLLWADVPSWLDSHIQDEVRRMYSWTTANRQDHWLFTKVFGPIADLIDAWVRTVLWVLRELRWTGVLTLTAAIGLCTGGWRAAVWGTVAMLGVGVMGFWDLTMITLSLMIVGITLALLIGIPLGIWTARSERGERLLRGFLDTAQVMPAFVYLGVLVLAFGIRYPPTVLATVVYAVPPAVRLTNHGLRSVPVVMNEVGESFGCTVWQQLAKVQLPIARRTILLGLNQVIMMAFGIVVIGSLLGTGDTGAEVLRGLQKNDVGTAAAAGMAIVFAAVALDRITTGERHKATFLERLIPQAAMRLALLAGVVLATTAITRIAGWSSFPDALVVDIKPAVDRIVEWVGDNLRRGVPIIGGTQAISDFLVTNLMEPLREFLVWLPWLVVVALIGVIGWVSGGWRLGVTVAACMFAIAVMGDVPGGASGRTTMWDHAMDTLSQVIVALAITVMIALPLGILAGRSPVANRALRPVLDTAQVLPQLVYLVPVLILFLPGRSAGVIASVIYAVPPCVRLTALGLSEVPVTPREAAISFGATPRQELFKVQLPLAFRSVMLGINQTVLMVLATVIIAALIGGGALGLLSLGGFQKQQSQIGQGLAAGLSIVCLAIVLDRITQAWGRPRPDHR
jgi:glycine betaine/proline transport system permease protein